MGFKMQCEELIQNKKASAELTAAVVDLMLVSIPLKVAESIIETGCCEECIENPGMQG